MKKWRQLLSVGALASWITLAFGSTPSQDFTHLNDLIGDFVRANGEPNARYEVTTDAPDPRLQLPLCAESLQVFLPPGHRLLGATLVGVRCNTSRSWVTYVSTHVKLRRKVATLRNAVARGARIESRDLTFNEQDIGSLVTGYFVDADQVIGKVAKRPLPPGVVLTPAQLVAPRWVTRGDIVTLLVDVGGLQVRARGEALADGGEHDRIKARNILSGKVVVGIVSGPGTVRIQM